MNVLISGLNNYVGRRSLSLFADENFGVFAVTRNLKLFEKRMFEPMHGTVYEGDLIKGVRDFPLNAHELKAGIYYTQVPTLYDEVNLKLEVISLRNFIQLLQQNSCQRVVYVARLVDRMCIEPILSLLRELRVDYTIILKNCVVGHDSLVDRVIRDIANRKFVFYSKFYATHALQPIGVRDFFRWLKLMLDVPAFKNRVVELGGANPMSLGDLFNKYKELKMVHAGQIIVDLPKWFVRLVYRKHLDISATDQAEFSRIMRVNSIVDNDWRKQMPFRFSPIEQVLLEDQEFAR
ncbi:MAG: hypothetical protein ACTJHT_02230 [Sphingobacterium sp.]|uniref:hypothetical protein n=1 Tax=Sphingobacterium sp. JB170 TaxID=1434842 RepID=UPI00097E7EEE|nr:hypothetical protein [Sphingobacterium sp. JB170]SJN40002.1 hypothetical protein FM107_10390 [Sphingobacterium sp. JB170]